MNQLFDFTTCNYKLTSLIISNDKPCGPFDKYKDALSTALTNASNLNSGI
jgi:hypothetical protein